ncbi:MAG: hypothetical protein KC457_12395 [Myxococcales bacterium]|nr:hypothetical protein [Myxococcales bacterium]
MPDSSEPALETETEAETAADAEARRRTGLRVLLTIAVVLSGLMVVFGSTTARNYDEFEAYRRATLENQEAPPRWQVEHLDVDGCVDAVLDWIEDCPGVSSWCEGSLPDVTNSCLETIDLGPYCQEVGDEVMSTRFGYGECAERYDAIEGRYARRAAKKHCSLIYRTLAGRCQQQTSRELR